ncbi:MAG TPA: GGDEF domain-containing protein [Solirubrobacteraceae bacterium]|nr:GGDEF domain-containing protein [Solirubrobacteraceae bacterium]
MRNPTKHQPWLDGLAVIAAIGLCWLPTYLAGGAGQVPPLWVFVPILFAAVRFGVRGALVASVVSSVVAGPLTPENVAHGTPQAASDWVIRSAFFVGIGLVMAIVTSRSRREAALHREARAEAEHTARLLEKDIAARQRLELELRRQALYDALTDLPNRAGFGGRIEQAVARQRRHGAIIAVLFMDLDNFKEINDTLGHRYGDELLTLVAARLRSAVRVEDTVARVSNDRDTVARFGGDEYAILLEDMCQPTDAAVVAERIMDELRAPFPLQRNRELFVTASLGIAIGDPEATADELLRRADVAMYSAKRQGKGRYEIFTASLDRAVFRRQGATASFWSDRSGSRISRG